MRWVFAIATLAVCLTPSFAAAQSEGSGRSDAGRRDARHPSTEEPLTPGFGQQASLPPVPGFGIAAAEAQGVHQTGVPLNDRFHPNVVAYAEQIVRRYDRNGSGKLERDEWSAARWRSDPAGSDLDQDGVLTLDELCERVKSFDEFRGLSGSAGSSGNSSGTSSAASSDRAKFDEYAKSLITRYDRNDNGVLDADETAQMSSFHRGADANGDRVITRDELAVRLANYGSAGGSSESREQAASKTPATSGRSARSSAGASARHFRVRTAAERLPQGLPDWFVRNDADGDGQIAMAEFAAAWSEAKYEEFRQIDRNGDGLVTPQECLSAPPAVSDAGRTERARFGRSWGR